jgi:transposase
MRVSVANAGKTGESVYIVRDIYFGSDSPEARKGRNRTTRTVLKLGRMSDLMKQMKMSREEVIAWARKKAQDMTEAENKANAKVTINLDPTIRIRKDVNCLFDCGYLFLQSLYYQLRLNRVCRMIKTRHQYQFDLNAILRDLICARILEPCSKRATYQYCQTFLEPPAYQPYDVYRALSVLAEEMDYIQAEAYKNSNFLVSRKSRVLYYDCTNYYFEIEEADELRKYGKSKEHRPEPIVQMGLFIDSDGIPLAFNLFDGSASEQNSLTDTEARIMRDYAFDKAIVCTDAGLGSDRNRAFNDKENRSFIVTQSLKKLKKEDRNKALDGQGWKRLPDGKAVQNMAEIMADPASHQKELYYKEEPYGTRRVPGQLMIVTYSPKYALYQKSVRSRQIERAAEMVRSGTKKSDKRNPNDPARFLTEISTTKDGEVAENTAVMLDQEKIDREAMYDGFYAICTNLVQDSVKDILAVSEGRWEIEESFRIMKTDFSARPAYVSREDRIRAHFLTCYLALLVYRLLEKKLQNRYTSDQIISTLRSMKLFLEEGTGYRPAYMRTEITDSLHEAFGFYTDYQILKKSKVRSIIHQTKTV